MFTATVVGKDKNGRKITEGRETYKTPSGVYEIKDWARLVEKAAEADGLLPLLEQIKRHVKEYAWMKNASDINVLILAAECLTGRAYEHWEGFVIPMNTQADETGQLTFCFFAPNKTRQLVSTQIAVTTKLAATEAIDTQMIMGINMRTGQIEIAEYDGQIRGQMSFNDLQAQEQPAEPAQATTPAANETQPAAGAEEQQPAPTGKPLDLKNRNKKPAEVPTDQEQEKAEAAAGELVPGRDFDPETGEVFENGRPPVDQPTTTEQPKSNQHKVITMGPKAVNA